MTSEGMPPTEGPRKPRSLAVLIAGLYGISLVLPAWGTGFWHENPLADVGYLKFEAFADVLMQAPPARAKVHYGWEAVLQMFHLPWDLYRHATEFNQRIRSNPMFSTLKTTPEAEKADEDRLFRECIKEGIFCWSVVLFQWAGMVFALTSRRRLAWIFGLIALVLASPIIYHLLFSEENNSYLLLGFWLWVLSLILLATSGIIPRIIERRWSQTRSPQPA